MSGYTKEQIDSMKLSDIHIQSCIKCMQVKLCRKFGHKLHRPTGVYYINTVCYQCEYKRKLEVHGNSIASYNENQRRKVENTIEGRAMYLRNCCKQRAKVRNMEFNLSKEVIIEKLRYGRCEVTGIVFQLGTLSNNPYSPSIDRVDNTGGYTDDNIQLVCAMYNFCKNEYTDDQVKEFIRIAVV